MGMDIDESRSDQQPAGIDFTACRAGDIANRGDFPLLYGDRSGIDWCSGAITNARILDQQIV
jgi:hypothetical protein